MKDKDKTKEQLINELEGMREQIAKLDASEVEQEQDGKTSSLSEEEYKRLFDLVPIGVTMLDMNGVVLYCNAAVYNKGGYPEDSFTGKHFTKIASVRLQDIPTYIRVFNSIVMGKVPKQFEGVYQRNDGTTGWTEVSISLLELGGKRHILVMQHDITEGKRAEENMRESQEKYLAIFEDPTSANIYFDTKGRLALVNQKAAQILGKPVKDIVGKHVKDVYPARTNDVYWERVRRALEKGETAEHTDFIESTDKWFLTRIVPISDASGTIIGVLASTRDITEQKQMEERLQFLGSITEQVSDSVVVTDTEYQIIYINKAAEDLFGYRLDEIRGKDPGILNAEPLAEKIQNEIYETVSSGKVWSGQNLAKKKDGSTFFCDFRVCPIKDQKGQIVHYVGIQYDATERKQAEDLLKENQRRMEELQVLGKIGSWEYDIDSQEITWSRETYILYERDPALGPPTTEEEAQYYPAEQAQILGEYAARSIDNGEQFTYDVDVFLPSGKKSIFNCIMRPVLDERGRVTKLFGTVQDITERKKTEELLQKSEERYRSFVENFSGIIYRGDSNFNLDFFHGHVREITGYSADDFIKGKIKWQDIIHEDDL
ncbi:PAS domain S-box protein, partial [Chloroflexota bacterium]